jgi:hypothetical protein
MHKKVKLSAIYVIAMIMIIAILTVIAVKLLVGNTNTSIPASIVSKVSFTIFYPQKNIPHVVQENKSVAYNTNGDALSFLVYVDNKAVYVSEQSTPDIFNQSGVYDYKLSQAKEYNDFMTEAGEITLTRPAELNGETVAWDNSKGTLILTRAIKPLSVTEWKLLFNNLDIINT